MNCVTELVRTEALASERFEHRPNVAHRDPERERAVTHAVGLGSLSHFAPTFRRRYGVRPSDVRAARRRSHAHTTSHRR